MQGEEKTESEGEPKEPPVHIGLAAASVVLSFIVDDDDDVSTPAPNPAPAQGTASIQEASASAAAAQASGVSKNV